VGVAITIAIAAWGVVAVATWGFGTPAGLLDDGRGGNRSSCWGLLGRSRGMRTASKDGDDVFRVEAGAGSEGSEVLGSDDLAGMELALGLGSFPKETAPEWDGSGGSGIIAVDGSEDGVVG
jgi:hypothetical protein